MPLCAHLTAHGNMSVAVRTEDPRLQSAVVRAVRSLGYTVHAFDPAPEAAAAIRVDAAILDERLADFEPTLARFRAASPRAGLIVLSGSGDARSVMNAIELGAEVVCKPVDLRSLAGALDSAICSGSPRAGPRVVAEDPTMVARLEELGRAANTDLTLVLIGECGTGKSLLARWAHAQSARRHGPRIEISGLDIDGPHGLDVLRGQEIGGEVQPGRLEAAHGGTLLLDGIEDFPLEAQELVLSVFQDGEVWPRGAARPVHVDSRVIVTARRPLAELVATGCLTEPLMHRIGVCPIEIPPLRTRPDDIDALSRSFASKLARELGERPPVLDEEAMRSLRARSWRGNVRELENWMQRAALSFPGTAVRIGTIDAGLQSVEALPGGSLNLEQLERAAIARSLHENGGTRNRAARTLGISPRTLRNKIRKYELG